MSIFLLIAQNFSCTFHLYITFLNAVEKVVVVTSDKSKTKKQQKPQKQTTFLGQF